MLAVYGGLKIWFHQCKNKGSRVRLFGLSGNRLISADRASTRGVILIDLLFNPFSRARYEPIFSLGFLLGFYLSSMKPSTRDNHLCMLDEDSLHQLSDIPLDFPSIK